MRKYKVYSLYISNTGVLGKESREVRDDGVCELGKIHTFDTYAINFQSHAIHGFAKLLAKGRMEVFELYQADGYYWFIDI